MWNEAQMRYDEAENMKNRDRIRTTEKWCKTILEFWSKFLSKQPNRLPVSEKILHHIKVSIFLHLDANKIRKIRV